MGGIMGYCPCIAQACLEVAYGVFLLCYGKLDFIDYAYDYVVISHAYSLCLIMMYRMLMIFAIDSYNYGIYHMLTNASYMLMLMIYASHHI
uniref:Putative ovule protein n=1 Tax=Solanum chacoense TaxID=4108 RepID=A0A0V0GLV0_SOLCH